jgi:Rad3-related DNA helicase
MSEQVIDLIKKYFPFKDFREQQLEATEQIIDSLTDGSINHFILESPTGVGKSVVGYTSARTIYDKLYKKLPKKEENKGPDILIVTSTKMLQTQYDEQFKNRSDVNILWSAQNYPCELFPEYEETNDKVYYGHSLCPTKDCMKISNCEYNIQKNKFKNSQVGITNYHYFFNAKFLNPRILIMDEAHNIQKILCDQAAITLSELSLVMLTNNIIRNSKIKHIGAAPFINKIKQFTRNNDLDIDVDIKPYILKFIEKFNEVLRELNKHIELLKSKKPKNYEKYLVKLNKAYEMTNNTIERYEKFLYSKTSWIISQIIRDHENNKLTIKPLEIYEYFNSLIASRTEKCIFMSATICGFQQYAKELGLDEDKFDALQTRSIIPVENRIIYYVNNLGGLNNRNKFQLLPKFIEIIDRIIVSQYKKDENVNGIIHTVSYDNAQYIKKHSRFHKNMIIPERGELLNFKEIIGEGKKIILSPSILEGVDLIDDLSRFQIFIKVPYDYLGDNWVKTKCNIDPKWYSRSAIVKIVQGSGRSVRSEDDWANTYILDSNFGRLWGGNQELFPEWFTEGIKSISV